MKHHETSWELSVIGGVVPAHRLDSIAAGDDTATGTPLIVAAGADALLAYKPGTWDSVVIATGSFSEGLVLEHVNAGSRPDIFTGVGESANPKDSGPSWRLVRYRHDSAAGDAQSAAGDAQSAAGDAQSTTPAWTQSVIDPSCPGEPCDLLFCDIDGDGERELIATIGSGPRSGVVVYKAADDSDAAWTRHTICTGNAVRGLAVSDLDGDGAFEVVAGPDWFHRPANGPFAGEWERHTFAPGFREACRILTVDITGSGRDDIVICETAYPNARLSWLENRLQDAADEPWVEHVLVDRLAHPRALALWPAARGADPDDASGSLRLLVGESGSSRTESNDARLLLCTIDSRAARATGETRRDDARVSVHTLYRGAGTRGAIVVDMDVDGGTARHVVSISSGAPRLHVFTDAPHPSPLAARSHSFIDRNKPSSATELFTADIVGRGSGDIVCGTWWYRNPDWKRFELPLVYQAINAFDVDGDGRVELICTRKRETERTDFYSGLSSRLCWLKPVDPLAGEWEVHDIGDGAGDWPHGNTVGFLGANGRVALAVCYHDVNQGVEHAPELFVAPDDPTKPWARSQLTDYYYGEEIIQADITGNGRPDLVTAEFWLENRGDGTFARHEFSGDFFDLERMAVQTEDHGGSRVALLDVTGNGRLDIVVGEQALDFTKRIAPPARLVWFEQPDDPRDVPWPAHVIDTMVTPHSLETADLDGDGEDEIVCGEHNPFAPYASGSRVMVYKRANAGATAWKRYVLDDRFEHHVGTKIISLTDGRRAVISQAWQEYNYLHAWTVG